MSYYIAKHIEFFIVDRLPGEKRKTAVFKVGALSGGVVLGYVKWYSPWRCYCFFPTANTLYERRCLRDLADFCESETRSHLEFVKSVKSVVPQ